jgi:hypothetical protein
MISHGGFGALRLAQFLPDAEIAELEKWEFMNHVWLGEAGAPTVRPCHVLRGRERRSDLRRQLVRLQGDD